MKRGFTLIEVIVYLAVLTFLIGSGVSAAYYIIDSSEKNKSDINIEAEAYFLLRKIEWAMTYADLTNPINSPASGTIGNSLSVNKTGTGIVVIDAPSSRARISIAGAPAIEITNDRVKIENLQFNYIAAMGTKPGAIKATFTINGRNYETTKYLRK